MSLYVLLGNGTRGAITLAGRDRAGIAGTRRARKKLLGWPLERKKL